MRKLLERSLVAAFVTAAPGVAPSFADTPKMKSIYTVGKLTSQPIGHYEFCKVMPEECSVTSEDPKILKMNGKIWTLMNLINNGVNKNISPMNDVDIFGVGRDEVWAYPDGVGDCEDYALEKRRALMREGFPASSLLMTVVRKPDGEGHAIVTVVTDKGDFVLDNLTDKIVPVQETPYKFLKRVSAEHSGKWRELVPGAATETASTHGLRGPIEP